MHQSTNQHISILPLACHSGDCMHFTVILDFRGPLMGTRVDFKKMTALVFIGKWLEKNGQAHSFTYSLFQWVGAVFG